MASPRRRAVHGRVAGGGLARRPARGGGAPTGRAGTAIHPTHATWHLLSLPVRRNTHVMCSWGACNCRADRTARPMGERARLRCVLSTSPKLRRLHRDTSPNAFYIPGGAAGGSGGRLRDAARRGVRTTTRTSRGAFTTDGAGWSANAVRLGEACAIFDALPAAAGCRRVFTRIHGYAATVHHRERITAWRRLGAVPPAAPQVGAPPRRLRRRAARRRAAGRWRGTPSSSAGSGCTWAPGR